MSDFEDDKSTRELVWEEASKMFFDESTKPSTPIVRARIGRGSNGTIQTALNAWWVKIALELKEHRRHGGVPEEVSEAFSGFWNVAMRAAEDKLAQDRLAMQEVLDVAARNATALSDTISNLEALRRSDAESAMHLNIELAEMSARANEANAALAAEKSRTDGLQREANTFRMLLDEERAKNNIELARLRDENTKRLIEVSERFDGLQKSMMMETDRARQETIRARESALIDQKKFDGEIADLQTKVAQQMEQRVTVERGLSAAQHKFESTLQMLSAITKERDQLAAKLAEASLIEPKIKARGTLAPRPIRRAVGKLGRGRRQSKEAM